MFMPGADCGYDRFKNNQLLSQLTHVQNRETVPGFDNPCNR